jgi:peptide/nickel transport system ATP-binding protein
VIHEIATVHELFKNPIHPYTKALMESIPKMDSSLKRLKTLKGMVPSILELGDQCKLCSRFDPDECACGGTKVEPELVEIEKDHFVRINLDILKNE